MKNPGDTFEQNPEDYSQFRPIFSPAVYDRVVAQVRPESGCRILEIGCGTGQATGFFVNFQPRQTCIDPGERLLTGCRSAYPQFEFICCRFEDFRAPPEQFDLIYAATSVHWIDKSVRFVKAASLLKPGACLIVMTDRHAKNLTGFFTEVNTIYDQIAPDIYSPFKQSDEPEQPASFRLIEEFEVDRELSYSADEYIGLLRTFSGHIALGEERLDRLCQEIHLLISHRYAGKVRKTLTTYVLIYRKN